MSEEKGRRKEHGGLFTELFKQLHVHAVLFKGYVYLAEKHPESARRLAGNTCDGGGRSMVWIENWDTFYAEAEKLFLEHPEHVSFFAGCLFYFRLASSIYTLLTTAAIPIYSCCFQTRYVTKYRHVDGKLELKVTNDRVCLKFITDQQQDLKRIDKLNNLLLTHMVGVDPYAAEPEGGEQGQRPPSGGDAQKQGSADDSAIAAAAGGPKKKKKR